MFWRKPAREEGISCVVRAKNEENWLRMSLLSIKDFADEIIFVDNASSDRTLEIARSFQEEFCPAKMKIFPFPALDARRVKAADLANFAFRQASKSFVMKWDADFIGRTEGPFALEQLKMLWYDLREKVDKYRISAPNLWGDHEHFREVWPGYPEFCFENYLWRNRGYHWEMDQDGHEAIRLRRHKREMRIGPRANPEDRRTYWLHLKSLESEALIFFRVNMVFWWKYGLDHPRGGMTYDEWCARQWGSPDRAEQIRKMMDLSLGDGHLLRFTKIGGEWGDYPGLMRAYLERPKYRIVYEDGRPHHRETLPGVIPCL